MRKSMNPTRGKEMRRVAVWSSRVGRRRASVTGSFHLPVWDVLPCMGSKQHTKSFWGELSEFMHLGIRPGKPRNVIFIGGAEAQRELLPNTLPQCKAWKWRRSKEPKTFNFSRLKYGTVGSCARDWNGGLCLMWWDTPCFGRKNAGVQRTATGMCEYHHPSPVCVQDLHWIPWDISSLFISPCVKWKQRHPPGLN